MGDDPGRSTCYNAAHRLVAWSYSELCLMGSLARDWSFPSKPLERYRSGTIPKPRTKHAPSICFTIRRCIAHFSLCRAGVGLLRLERTIVFVAGVYEVIQLALAAIPGGEDAA